jgi:hypothetical protein
MTNLRTTIFRTTIFRTSNLRRWPFSKRPFSEGDHSPNDQSPKDQIFIFQPTTKLKGGLKSWPGLSFKSGSGQSVRSDPDPHWLIQLSLENLDTAARIYGIRKLVVQRMVVREMVAFVEWLHFSSSKDWSFGDWSFREWSFGEWSFGDWSFGEWSLYCTSIWTRTAIFTLLNLYGPGQPLSLYCISMDQGSQLSLYCISMDQDSHYHSTVSLWTRTAIITLLYLYGPGQPLSLYCISMDQGSQLSLWPSSSSKRSIKIWGSLNCN